MPLTVPSTDPIPSPSERGGFTLIEIVLALVILAILAGTAAPRFFEQSTFDERVFRDTAVTAIRYAQKLAVVTGCEVQVTVASNAYTLNQRSACSSGAYTQDVPQPGTGESDYTQTAPTGIGFTSDVTPLVFDALGRAQTGAGVVTDVNVTVGTRSIAIEGETGLVRAL